MGLLSSMLHFTEEQKVVVGLKVPPPTISLQKGLASLISAVVGPGSGSKAAPAEAPQLELQGDSLGEKWVNFLLQEATPSSTLSDSSKDGGFS